MRTQRAILLPLESCEIISPTPPQGTAPFFFCSRLKHALPQLGCSLALQPKLHPGAPKTKIATTVKANYSSAQQSFNFLPIITLGKKTDILKLSSKCWIPPFFWWTLNTKSIPDVEVETVVEVVLATVAAVDNGVNRKRWMVPFGIAACINCWPGPGITVTPCGINCNCPVVWPWPWITTVNPWLPP